MAFVQTQTLEYREHKEEMEAVAKALDFLERRDVQGAIAVLIARHVYLLAGQRPILKDYDPRAVRA